MKKIILVRHGKAEVDSPEITDFERSLTLKGKLVSRLMAKKLKSREKSLGIIITSPAFRALETAQIFAGEYNIKPENIKLNSKVYNGLNLKNLSGIISEINEDEEVITLFGHNPTFSEMANDLSREGSDGMAKSGIAGIYFDVLTWSEIGRNKGKLEYFLKPAKNNE